MTTRKKMMIGLAVIFGMYGGAMLAIRHDLHDGLWAFAVCIALILGIVPARKQSRPVPDPQSQLDV
ncbi:MAG: hypothetical protein ACRD8A_10740 [Candidatus Acidiferrales bacterium]